MSSRPLRIAMVAACPLPCPRGTPVRVFRMAEALQARGHDVHVVAYHLGDAEPEAGFAIHRTRHIGWYTRTEPGPTWTKLLVLDPLLSGKVWRVLRRMDVDVIHAHHVEGLIAAWLGRGMGRAVGRRRVPIVFDAHTRLQAELPHYKLGLSQRLMRMAGGWGDRLLPRLADHVVAVSDEIRGAMETGGRVPPERVTVAANGVEARPFLDADAAGGAGGVEPGLVVFTGNLAAYQGIGLLLTAMKRLIETRPELGARLRIVTTDASDWPMERAAELGIAGSVAMVRVGFDGVPGELAKAVVGVSPRTDCDGVPQKILNMMAAAKPVVAFAGSARHIVDGVNGRVVANDDTDGFAEALGGLLSAPDEARRMGEAGRSLVREQLSWDHTAAQCERVYARLLAGGASGVAPREVEASTPVNPKGSTL